jgi:phenylacetic acid degradation operon negative regulatory protein
MRAESARALPTDSAAVAAAPHELQPQELVITFAGAYMRLDQRPVWSGGLVELLGYFGFTPGSARVSLARLVKRNLLERVRAGRLVFYRPTARTHALLAEGDRRIFELTQPVTLDGPWTFVWYSLPDELRVARHRLSRRLRFLGFGSIEDSNWICPRDERRDVRLILAELDVTERAAIFLSTPENGPGLEQLISSAWNLPDLADRYGRYASAFGPAAEHVDDLDDRAAFVIRTLAMDSYRRFPFLDPGLPRELLPPEWPREEAERIFRVLWTGLETRAQRHFEKIARPPGQAANAAAARAATAAGPR